VQLNHDIRKMAGWRFAWLPSNAMPNHAIEAVRSYADLFRLLGIESECFSDRGKAVAWCERA
jgi:hypothetical protein